MLFDIFSAPDCANLDISESIEHLDVIGTIDLPLKIACERIIEELRNIPSRDSFELIIDARGNNIKLGNLSNELVSDFFREIHEYPDLEICDLSLKISKAVVNFKLSVYFFAKFADYVAGENASDLLDELAKCYEGLLYFEVQHEIVECQTATIKFVRAGHSYGPETADESARAETLELLVENSTTANLRHSFLPSDFHFIVRSDNIIIERIFSSLSAMLCLRFISNYSKLIGNDFSYKITGYKSIVCDGIAISEIARDQAILYRIYAWAYGGGNNSDKIGLIRNVLSIHLSENGRIKFDTELWNAVQSNYQIYLKGNVQNYLEVKNKLSELIMEFTNKTYGFADQVLDSFKTNAFIILTFLLTVVVVNGLKDSGEITVFSNAYFGIVMLVSLVSGLWLLLTKRDVLERFDNSAKAISAILKASYGQVLLDAEIDSSIDPVITLNRTYLDKQVRKYTGWWFGILLIFLLAFAIGNRVFSIGNMSSSSARATGVQTQSKDDTQLLRTPTEAKVTTRGIGTKAPPAVQRKAPSHAGSHGDAEKKSNKSVPGQGSVTSSAGNDASKASKGLRVDRSRYDAPAEAL